MISTRANASRASKNDVEPWISNDGADLQEAAAAWQEATIGHAEEFRHGKSAFVF